MKLINRIATACIIFAIVYHLAINSYENMINNMATEDDINETNENNTDNINNEQNHRVEVQNKNTINDEAIIKLEGGIFSQFISNVLTNVLKTKEGRQVFKEMVTIPQRQDNLSDDILKYDSNKLLSAMFSISDDQNIDNNDSDTENKIKENIAICGNIITAKYKVSSYDNEVIKEGTATWRLGEELILPYIDAVITGMKINSTRNAIISDHVMGITKKKGDIGTFKLEVELKEIKTNNLFIKEDVKIFDQEISYSKPIICGDNVNFDIKITDLSSDQIIFDSINKQQKISMKVGESNYPMILSYMLHGKMNKNTRTAITKGNMLRSFVSNYSTLLPNTKLNDNAYYMIDIYSVENIDNKNIR